MAGSDPPQRTAPDRKILHRRNDAQALARQIASEIDRGTYVDRAEAEATTVGDLIDRYSAEVTSLTSPHPGNEGACASSNGTLDASVPRAFSVGTSLLIRSRSPLLHAIVVTGNRDRHVSG